MGQLQMKLNNSMSMLLVIFLNLLVYIYMGWEVIQISARRNGFDKDEIYEFVKLLFRPHKELYTRLNFRPHKTQDFFAQATAIFYILLGPILYLVFISQIIRDRPLRVDLIIALFVLLPLYIFFLCSGLKAKSDKP